MILSFHSSNYLKIEAILCSYSIMHCLLHEIAVGDNDIDFMFRVDRYSSKCDAQLQVHGFNVTRSCYGDSLYITVTSEMPF